MKIRMLVATSCLIVLSLGTARAQQPTTAEVNDAMKRLKAEQAAREKIDAEKVTAAAKVAADTKAATTRRQAVNIKLEFTLSDQRGGSAPIKRTVSAIVADGGVGQIRSQSFVNQLGNVPLNIDTTPELLVDGKVRVGFTLQYDWPLAMDAKETPRGTVMTTSIHESVTLILESGKPMVAAQSADPIGDRQVSVEVKATVLR
jgi:hypothetical protein